MDGFVSSGWGVAVAFITALQAAARPAGRFLVAEEVGERVEQHRHKMLSPFPWRGRESQSFVVVFTIQHRQGV